MPRIKGSGHVKYARHRGSRSIQRLSYHQHEGRENDRTPENNFCNDHDDGDQCAHERAGILVFRTAHERDQLETTAIRTMKQPSATDSAARPWRATLAKIARSS